MRELPPYKDEYVEKLETPASHRRISKRLPSSFFIRDRTIFANREDSRRGLLGGGFKMGLEKQIISPTVVADTEGQPVQNNEPVSKPKPI